MNMRPKVSVCFWLLALAVVCFAQDGKTRPDFSGSWVLDASKSEFGRGGGGQGSSATGTLIVTMKDAEFKMSRKIKLGEQERATDLLYYTDERGETNPGLFGASDVKSKTKWQGSKIVSKATVSRTMPSGDSITFEVEETWEMSEDGKVFTNTLTMSAPMGTRTVKYVYNRAP
jgi:hypothetical protein